MNTMNDFQEFGIQENLGITRDDVISISVDFMLLLGRVDGVISKAAGGKLADPYVPPGNVRIQDQGHRSRDP